jgi:TonB family protein
MISLFNDMIQLWWQWMSSMFWQASLLVLIVTVIDMAIRRWAWPQVRYVLWGLVFLKLVIPPAWQMPTSVVSWLQPRVENQISIRIETVETTDRSALQSNTASPLQSRNEDPSDENSPPWQAALFIAWIAGVAVFTLKIMIRITRLRKLSRRPGGSVPEWFHELLAATAQRMKLKKIPTVVFSGNTTGPAVFGLFRPVLLLPEGSLEKLSKQEATHVLLHELCHLKRGDLVLHWFSLLLQIVYWFNPLLLWTRRQMRHVCEICCDLSVADILREKTLAYRSTLLSSARELLSETVDSSLGFLGIFEDPFRLVSRLKWLEKNTWENPGQRTAAVLLTALVMIFFVMPMNGLSQPAASSESLPAQPDNTVPASGKTQTPDNPEPQPFIFLEALILEVAGGTDLDIDCLEMEEVPDGAPVTKCDSITIEGERYSDLETAIQGLSNMSGVKILARPKMLTLNEKTALIKVGKAPGGKPTSTDDEGFDYLLEITPQLLEYERIHQYIYLETTWTNHGGISTHEVDTEAVIREGETLAIVIPLPETSKNGTDGGLLYCLMTSSIHMGSDVPMPEEMMPMAGPSQSNDPPNEAEDFRWIQGVKMPEPPPASEELGEIPHGFRFGFEPEPAEEVDTPPMLPAFGQPPPPQYPIAAAQNGIEGRVVLRFMVGTDGKAKNPEVVEADPEGVFEESMLVNIEQFEFTPATLAGEPVPCMVNYTIWFELD